MLALLEATTCKDNGKVGRDVGVRISHIASVEHHRMVKQRSTILFTALKVSNQVAQKLHVLTVNTLKVTHLFLVTSVVREVMVTIRDRMAFDLNRRRVDTVEHQCDIPRRVRLKCHPGHVVHQANLVHVLLGILWIKRHFVFGHRTWLVFPSRTLEHPLFKVTHTG